MARRSGRVVWLVQETSGLLTTGTGRMLQCRITVPGPAPRPGHASAENLLAIPIPSD